MAYPEMFTKLGPSQQVVLQNAISDLFSSHVPPVTTINHSRKKSDLYHVLCVLVCVCVCVCGCVWVWVCVGVGVCGCGCGCVWVCVVCVCVCTCQVCGV